MARNRDVKLILRAMETAGSIPEAQPAGGLQSREVSGTASVLEDLSALKRHFEISLYFLLLPGVLTVGATGKLDLVSILVPPAALLIKGYRWWRGKGPEISNRVGGWRPFSPPRIFPL